MKTALMLGGLAAVLWGCMPQKEDSVPAQPAVARPADAHTSRNSLDWGGVYEGVLPCADCPGIETRLRLERDGTYELSTRYLDRQDVAQTKRGRFTWHPGGNAIALDASGFGHQFSVGEGRLSLLNRDGTTEGSQSPNRVLTRVTGSGLTQTLEAHHWNLESATDGQNRRIDAVLPSARQPFVFSFSGPRLTLTGACNQMSGSYRITAEGQLEVGRIASTMMGCEPALMRADAALSGLLAKPMRIDVVKGAQPQLRLVTASNETLLLTGQATPETRYGSGIIMFLEVAAQRAACMNPLTSESTCLQVRERRYDQEGLVVGTPGEWRPLYESIEGYTHREGERNVLRIKRFQRSPAPAGASSSVYVLDAMVESEIMTR